MYHLPGFQEKNKEEIIAFIKAHPFATLIGVSADHSPVATQIPVLLKEKEGAVYLQGHFMKQTDHHKAFLQNEQVLVLFNGPHAYISASWYENKKQASTWNYMTVHARGTIRLLHDDALPEMLEELTAYFEQDPSSPSQYKELPEDYINRLSKAIVAFEIKLLQTDAVFKLSQNRDEKSFDNIVSQLSSGNWEEKAVAEEMSKRKRQFFTNE
ncbi:MAG: hypothetical protein RLZZ429_404 [Bacteroidota bacterium]|jgi:transcriptional regulator